MTPAIFFLAVVWLGLEIFVGEIDSKRKTTMAALLWNNVRALTRSAAQETFTQQAALSSRFFSSQACRLSEVSPIEAATTELAAGETDQAAEQEFARQNPIVSQLVNTIMRDGKKARAQRLVSDALADIRVKTNTDPLLVLTEAIESASPMLKLTSAKKGSKVVHVPTALRERQRRRKAIVWILEGAAKRPEKTFEARLSGELLSVINGASSALTKKNSLHKMALANRANAQVSYNMR
jgi:small subunit ribosomal protein S7